MHSDNLLCVPIPILMARPQPRHPPCNCTPETARREAGQACPDASRCLQMPPDAASPRDAGWSSCPSPRPPQTGDARDSPHRAAIGVLDAALPRPLLNLRPHLLGSQDAVQDWRWHSAEACCGGER
ncbi:hypothetical protein CCMA1212_010090 [Trichoderma ghanense]|uniref:Uncharacterized protein n=1 Tax=Trichoderma ghanense TaxID=65468 RepID=A0ABY2GSF7_9HYPO